MTKVSGKTALVTDASRGMARAAALALASMGAQVLVHYSSGVKEAEAVVAEIRKAGGRADAVAADLGERCIRVNAVAPGVVATDMSRLTKTDAGRDFALGIQALKRIAQPDDIGSVVAFLASDDARWISGDTLRVDGGSKL